MSHPIVLFDGVCNFCNATVNFIIRNDKKGVFRFAALQSEAGQKILKKYGLSKDQFNSFLLIEESRVFDRSTAALKIAKQLSLPWRLMQVFFIVPRFIRDGVYDVIAHNRYKWFGKKDSCMVPTKEMKSRFLD